VSKSKIYTRTGDEGLTALVSGKRISKADARIALYGEVDELNSRLGWLVASLSSVSVTQADKDFLVEIQSALFDLGSNLACEASERSTWKLPQLSESLLKRMEQSIDTMDATLIPLKNFVLPGGHSAAAAAHLCRTSCRSVERLMVSFGEASGEELPTNGVPFINRLSDFFFVFARYINKLQSVAEPIWVPARS
jgi:cob(I)alamin adenosyltransferase